MVTRPLSTYPEILDLPKSTELHRLLDDGEVQPTSVGALDQGYCTMLFFSSHKFNDYNARLSSLRKFYNTVNLAPPPTLPFGRPAKRLDLVFVSLDDSKADYEMSCRGQPWLAVPFEDRRTVLKLKSRFNIFQDNGREVDSSTLVELARKENFGRCDPEDASSKRGFDLIAMDPSGTDFPWRATKYHGVSASAQSVFQVAALWTLVGLFLLLCLNLAFNKAA